MSSPKIVVDDRKSAGRFAPSPERGWTVLWWVGVLMTLVTLADIALAFYPLRFKTMEWEFGTAASTFSELPLLALGLAALLAPALARGRRTAVMLISVLLVLLAVGLVGMLAVFLSDIPVALRSVASGDVKLGVEKAAVKTVGLGLLFAAAFVVAAVRSLAWSRSSGR